jgi:hypothetical protein
MHAAAIWLSALTLFAPEHSDIGKLCTTVIGVTTVKGVNNSASRTLRHAPCNSTQHVALDAVAFMQV